MEFQGAAYRFGHSLVRPSYRANLAGDNTLPFFAFIFDPAGEGQAGSVDLRGGARAPRRFIGWQTFFDFGGDQTTHVRPNKVIDTKISTPLFNLPLGAIPSGDRPTALPQRNLLRHLTWSIPSGQSIARAMNIRPLSPEQLKRAGDSSASTWIEDAALVLCAEGGGVDRRGAVGRRRCADRRRGIPRPAGGRHAVVSAPAAVAADAPQPGAQHLRHRRSPDVCAGRSGEPRAVRRVKASAGSADSRTSSVPPARSSGSCRRIRASGSARPRARRRGSGRHDTGVRFARSPRAGRS